MMNTMMNKKLNVEELTMVNGASRDYVCPKCGETHYTIQSIIHHCETVHNGQTGGSTRNF